MIIGRVVGEVWASRRHAGLDGVKLLIVQPHLWYCPPFEVAHIVAVDTLGAGVGEDVIVCMGEPARRALTAKMGEAELSHLFSSPPGYQSAAWLPVDAAVLGIVDQVQLASVESSASGTHRPLRFVGPTPAWGVDAAASFGQSATQAAESVAP